MIAFQIAGQNKPTGDNRIIYITSKIRGKECMESKFTSATSKVDDCTEFMTVKDIAAALRIGNTSAYKLVKSAGFPAIKIQHNYRISRSQFIKWCENYAGREYLL